MKNIGSISIVIIAVAIVVAILVFARKRPDNGQQQVPLTTTAPTSTTSDQTTQKPASMDNNTPTNTAAQPAATKPETTKMANGLEITILAKGSGTPAKAGDKVTVNYTGHLTDGTTFDSNVDPKFGHVQPFTFNLGAGQVIQGWDLGVVGMQIGEKRRLVIPSTLGYGAQGAGGAIPPNATLVFDVEVTKIN